MNAATDKLPWHDEPWRMMQDAARSGRLSHALLLAGPAGVGKRAFARRLAASLLCESRLADGAACGSCRGCTQRAAGSHPNLIWLTREFNEKTDKEKRDISMDQLRGMMDRLSLSSHYGQARVVVIEPADALNVNGVNAVLKTVEEPPPGSHLLLISERPMALAPTLRSRCQRLNFSVPPIAEAEAWLKAMAPGINASAALRDSAGAPLAALDAKESGALELRNAWREQLYALAAQRVDPLTAASKVDKDSAPVWLRAFMGLLREILRGLAGVDAEPRAQALAPRLGAAHVEQLLAEAVESQRRLQSNANPQLIIESLMISWWRRTAPTDTRKASNA